VSIAQSSRARGATRGGCGGGYERTSPSYNADRLREMRQTYDALEPKWREVFLNGLSRFERAVVTDRRMEIREE
jgi:hypothetical protein